VSIAGAAKKTPLLGGIFHFQMCSLVVRSVREGKEGHGALMSPTTTVVLRLKQD